MLDERIVRLARKTASPQLKDRDQSLAVSAGGIKAKWHGHGAKFQYLMELYRQEVGQRAEIAWRNLHRAHNSVGAPHTDALRGDLLEVFRADLDAVIGELRPPFDKDMEGATRSFKEPDGVSILVAARDRELARYEAEIEHYVNALEAAKARGSITNATYVVHGHVGAIVTGENAVTSIVQNIGAAEREELRNALNVVKEAITQSPELPERDRKELAEFADEAAAEISRESPNTRRLSLTLQTLAAAVQGIANGPAAYEALRAAAVAIGILL